MSKGKGFDINYDREVLGKRYDSFLERISEAAINTVVKTAQQLQQEYLARIESQRLYEQHDDLHGQLDEIRALLMMINEDDSLLAEFPSRNLLLSIKTIAGVKKLNETLEEFLEKARTHTDRALKAHIEESRAKIRSLTDSMRAGKSILLTADLLIPALNQSINLSTKEQAGQTVKIYLEKASFSLKAFSEKFPNHILSDAIQAVSKSIVESREVAETVPLFDQLSNLLRIEEADLTSKLEKREADSVANHVTPDSEKIGALIMSTLADMGYEVSGIEESCFVENGELFAKNKRFPNHAVKVLVDKEGARKFETELVRIAGVNAAQQIKLNEDEQFEDFFCSKEGIISLKEKLNQSSIGDGFSVTFKSISERKSNELLKELPVTKQPESIAEPVAYADKISKKVQQLRTRQSPRTRSR